MPAAINAESFVSFFLREVARKSEEARTGGEENLLQVNRDGFHAVGDLLVERGSREDLRKWIQTSVAVNEAREQTPALQNSLYKSYFDGLIAGGQAIGGGVGAGLSASARQIGTVAIHMQWGEHYVDFNDQLLQSLSKKFPAIKFVNLAPNDPRTEETLKEAEALLTYQYPVGGFKDVFPEKLKWVQLAISGVGPAMIDAAKANHWTVTNAKGVAAPALSDYCIGWIQAFERNLPQAIHFQDKNEWSENFFSHSPRGFDGLKGKTVGIIGTGEIGVAVAEKASKLGMRVIGVKRRVNEKPPHVDEVYSEASPDFLKQVDYLVVSVPLLKSTAKLIDEKLLSNLKEGAYVISVAADAVLDHRALAKAVQEKKIAGAAIELAVPPDKNKDPELYDVLFNTENLFVTPHTAAMDRQYSENVVNLFAENLERYLHSQPLKNEVDLEHGY